MSDRFIRIPSTVILLVLALLLTAFPVMARDDDAAIIHVLNRLGYGPRPGDVERVRAQGLSRYIDEQLHPDRIAPWDVDGKLSNLHSLTMTPAQIALHYPSMAMVNRIDKQAQEGKQGAQHILDMLPPADERGKPRDVLVDLVSQRIVRAVDSPRQLQEVMVDFWMNHFNVYWQKGADQLFLTGYERDVIRPLAMGKFRDLLLATARSPAMLFYLDNWLSESADAKATGKRKAGLNENYARELMELHTLGVDGGYTQKDVVEVARCFTGWTLKTPREGGGYTFRPKMHDRGQKAVLGHVIPAGGGERDALTVLDILDKDPHTAHFISLKLCRRFVSDDPPPALVNRVAAVFRKTDGDIRQVLAAIFASPEFNAPSNYNAKIKTPLELVASSIRAVDGDTDGGITVARALQRMGMLPYMCQPPTGYADRADAWVSTGGLLERMSFAIALMQGRMVGTVTHAEHLVANTQGDGNPDELMRQFAHQLLGRDFSPATRHILEKAMKDAQQKGSRDASKQMIGLMLGSPEFQRR